MSLNIASRRDQDEVVTREPGSRVRGRENGKERERERESYAILRTQSLLKQALPFLEQELADIVAKAYANLEVWTDHCYLGTPHTVRRFIGGRAGGAYRDPAGDERGLSPDSQADTVLVQQEPGRGRSPIGGPPPDRARRPPHRRRRLHAVMADSSTDESE